MRKVLALLLSSTIFLLPAVSFAAINQINTLTAHTQFLTTSPGTSTMHMQVNETGGDTHNFVWDNTPWRVDQGGTGATSFANGSVLFYSDGFSQDSANFFWDTVNKVLSIGTNAATSTLAKLTIKGSVGQSLLNLISSVGSSLFYISGSGNVGIGNTNPQHALDVVGALYSRLVILSGTSTIDWNAGNVQSLTLTSSPTLTFANGQAGGEYKLIIKQDNTGGHTISWPLSIKWAGGAAPTLTSNASGTDVASFLYDGTHYLGSVTSNYTVSAPVAVLMVGGGGGGGADGGGGGAGGYQYDSAHLVSERAYAVTVGSGGNGGIDSETPATNGTASAFDTISSSGGGHGGFSSATTGGNGGSGGGGSAVSAADGSAPGGNGNSPSTSPSQGNDGGNSLRAAPNYCGGGGGGASAQGAPASDGSNAGAGGAGTANSITGTSVTYAGGGGGSCYDGGSGNPGSGGAGGGGAGSGTGVGTADAANTGGGGGGGFDTGNAGGAGGSGVVVISYLTGSITATGGSITTSGGNTIHTFTSGGTFTVTSIP